MIHNVKLEGVKGGGLRYVFSQGRIVSIRRNFLQSPLALCSWMDHIALPNKSALSLPLLIGRMNACGQFIYSYEKQMSFQQTWESFSFYLTWAIKNVMKLDLRLTTFIYLNLLNWRVCKVTSRHTDLCCSGPVISNPDVNCSIVSVMKSLFWDLKQALWKILLFL